MSIESIDCKQCPEVYFGETGAHVTKRRNYHIGYIRKADISSALFIHMQNNPGHAFNLDGKSLVYRSNQKASRQLVESSLIANSINCTTRTGDFVVCKLTAPVVLQLSEAGGVHLKLLQPPTTTSSISASHSSPTTFTYCSSTSSSSVSFGQ